jgi:hypothetical protein
VTQDQNPQKVKDIGDMGGFLKMILLDFLCNRFSKNALSNGASISAVRLGNHISLPPLSFEPTDHNHMWFNKENTKNA